MTDTFIRLILPVKMSQGFTMGKIGKKLSAGLCLWAFLLAFTAHGQGTLVYDQQTVGSVEGGYPIQFETAQLQTGQSFTPTMSSVGFVQIRVFDSFGGSPGGTLYVNLRADSLTGPIMGSTEPVALPSLFSGRVDFFFPTPVSVTPGTTYYMQPTIQTGYGWSWVLMAWAFDYPGGTAYIDGTAAPIHDFWFAEGIVVPEPSSAGLLLFGAGALYVFRRAKSSRH